MENRFFDYDEIDHYFNDYDESKLEDLRDNSSKSQDDFLKMGILLGGIPEDLNDLSFISKLETFGYTKSGIDKAKFADMDMIFRDKTVSENYINACTYVYRDILIFKKQGKVSGIAKICFQCKAHEIRGAKVDTFNFGQDGDYERLEKLLRN